ncbi:hypothetical protein V1498_03215 [Peribacillus sp. SCS-26]|uniref:hypothetical protein n=1 Tax=Paraperibacillus marinus TaxID=3115295 RepID=UPI0039057DFB
MLDKKILRDLEEYLEDRQTSVAERILMSAPLMDPDEMYDDLEDYIKGKQKPSFKDILFTFIDLRGIPDSEIYKKAGIDRRHFSKIRSAAGYRPRKDTIISLALALKLGQEDTEDLLYAAGYSFSSSETRDLIILFCLERNIHDKQDVNFALHQHGAKTL